MLTTKESSIIQSPVAASSSSIIFSSPSEFLEQNSVSSLTSNFKRGMSFDKPLMKESILVVKDAAISTKPTLKDSNQPTLTALNYDKKPYERKLSNTSSTTPTTPTTPRKSSTTSTYSDHHRPSDASQRPLQPPFSPECILN